MRPRPLSLLGALVAIAGLAVAAWYLPRLRRALIQDVVTWDAPISEPAPFPAATGAGLAPVARTRVVLVDGLSEAAARTAPAWQRHCARGAAFAVDVGFPTVSLPVEVALWSGLTQQQTGVVFRSGRPLVPPLDRRGIPAQVPGSIAIAESHGYIVRSLGFATTEPAAGATPAVDAAPDPWKAQWQARARAAVASPAKLAFVHILRVDTAGHKHGGDSDAYRAAVAESDRILDELVQSAPDARWFLLSDHGHRPEGGHGGEEFAIRVVQACIVGPGISAGVQRTAAPDGHARLHVVDVARAIADSSGATLDRTSRGRPLYAALGSPLDADQAIPALSLMSGMLALFALALGFAVTTWGMKRWWLAPWWFPVACASLVLVRGVPTLSMRLVYEGSGKLAAITWIPALGLAAVATWAALGRMMLARVVVAQLAIPLAALAAAITACGAWPAVLGAEVAPVVPRYTAWLSPLVLMVAHGCAAVALGILARRVLGRSGRSSPPEPPHSERGGAPPAPAPSPRDRS